MKTISKVQKTKTAYSVYLPTKWIKERKIFKGDYMFIESKPNGSLVIRPLEERGISANKLRSYERDTRTDEPSEDEHKPFSTGGTD